MNETDEKYEFHEGDYVESADGRVGYIKSICHCDMCKDRGFDEPTIVYTDGSEDYISNHSIKNVEKDYIRIGQYLFQDKKVKRENFLYERQFRVVEIIFNKDGISQHPISDWQSEHYIHDAMSYFRNKIDKNEFCTYTYEERYVRVKEI